MANLHFGDVAPVSQLRYMYLHGYKPLYDMASQLTCVRGIVDQTAFVVINIERMAYAKISQSRSEMMMLTGKAIPFTPGEVNNKVIPWRMSQPFSVNTVRDLKYPGIHVYVRPTSLPVLPLFTVIS